jgi:DNA-directed RNA polymerase subunit RPC12/RpoP
MTCLGLVALLAAAMVTAVACLFWLDLRRIYDGQQKVKVHRRDRRLAVRHVQVLLATISEANRQQRIDRALSGPRPLPYWLWLVMMVLEGARRVGRRAGKMFRRLGRASLTAVGITLGLTGLGIRGIGKLTNRLIRWARGRGPGMAEALGRFGAATRRTGRWTVLKCQRNWPGLARRLRRTASGLSAGLAWSVRMVFHVLRRLLGLSVRVLAGMGLRTAEMCRSGGRRLRPTIQRASEKIAHPRPRAKLRTTPTGRGDKTGQTICCPNCGREKPAPPDGIYECSRCTVRFHVVGDEAKVEAVCPGCGKKRMVARLGQYECGDCATRFHLTEDGVRFEAVCPGCGKRRMVSRGGRFQCGDCSLVFHLQAGRSYIDSTCPTCGDRFCAPKPGFFRCQSCRTVFTVAPGRDAFLDSVQAQAADAGRQIVQQVQQTDQRRRQLDPHSDEPPATEEAQPAPSGAYNGA